MTSTITHGTTPVVPAPVLPPANDSTPATPTSPPDAVVVRRRTIDRILIGFGLVATGAFAIAGGLLMWGSQFAEDYVYDELSSQNITFPPEEMLVEDGRADLVQYADEDVTTGPEAEAYASFIDGHLQGIADGATYADLGTPERAAQAAVTEAVEAGASDAEIQELQEAADTITGQRDSLFRGETLRGLLLTAYAWSTVGTIAGLAAIGAFVAAAVMAVLVVLGTVHYRRIPKANDPAPA